MAVLLRVSIQFKIVFALNHFANNKFYTQKFAEENSEFDENK